MANTIRLKRSAVPGRVPQTSDLALGELAVNTYDGQLYLKQAVDSVETIVPVGVPSAAGSAGAVQFTDGAALAADSTFSFATASHSLTVGAPHAGSTFSGSSHTVNGSVRWDPTMNIVSETVNSAGLHIENSLPHIRSGSGTVLPYPGLLRAYHNVQVEGTATGPSLAAKFMQNFTASAAGAQVGGYGIHVTAQRLGAGDTSTHSANGLYGGSFTAKVDASSADTVATATLSGAWGVVQFYSGTATNATGVWAEHYLGSSTSAKTMAVTNAYGFRATATIGNTGAGSVTVTNLYGLYLATPTVRSNATITNRYGIYQQDPAAQNVLFGGGRFGGDTDYLAISNAGHLTLAGTATYWDDLLVEMKESLRGSNPKPDWDGTNFGLLFPQNDTSEYLMLNLQLPHRWKEGSTIHPHVHIHQASSSTPVFKLDYRWINLGDAVPGSWTTYTMNSLVKTYTSGTLSNIVKGAGLSGTGKTLSSILQVKLYRDDNVYSGDVLAVSFDVHIECDSLGSNTEYTK